MPEKLAAGGTQGRECTAFFDKQPEFRGRMLAVAVWEGEARYLAALTRWSGRRAG